MGGFTKVHGGLRKPRTRPSPGCQDAAGATELRDGDRCYRVDEDDDGTPALFAAAFMCKRRGACYFADPVTGECWQEAGMHWYGQARDAYRAYIDAHVSMLNAPETWVRVSECSREELFRRLVGACAQLDALEKQPHPPSPVR
jgi:hypothetical protein